MTTILDKVLGRERVLVRENERALTLYKGEIKAVLMPGEPRQDWVRRHPQAFGALAALEGVVRRWPVLRGLGDYAALMGARR